LESFLSVLIRSDYTALDSPEFAEDSCTQAERGGT
jgi:hypothetical protein